MVDRSEVEQQSEMPAAAMAVGGALSMKHREWIAGYLFILPDALGLLVFVGGPMLLSLSLGFFEVDGFGGYAFVGLANYRRMFVDPLFLQSLRVTLAYVALLVPALYIVGLGLALLVQRTSRLNGAYRSLLFMPQTVSLVVVALVWQFMLVDKIGLISRVASTIGLGGLSFLGDPAIALFAIVFISVWFLMGFYMLIFLGGLQDIPKEYYEAAKIDGAGPIKSFLHITLPLLQPTSFFVLLVSTVAAVCGSQTFDLIYVMTKGGPANSTSLAIYYIYQQAFLFNEFGYAAALASFLVLILLGLTLILFLLTGGGRFSHD
jgi:multiple sugar transport system permease protein